MKGAPIRFLAGVVGGWTGVRILMLLPEAEPLELAREVLVPRAAALGRTQPLAVKATLPGSPAAKPGAERASLSVPVGRRAAAAPPRAEVGQPRAVRSSSPPDMQDEPVLVPPSTGSLPERTAEHRRLRVSTWLLARGGADGTLSGGMLGGSQAGARATYTINARKRIALSARAAAPLAGRGAEAAVGVDWQPTRAPIHLLAEQRIALDGGRGGPTVMAIAGLNPTPVGAGFRLEAYAQGGAIWRGGRAEAFGDGAVRLTRPVSTVGGATLDAGIGGWAARQHGAARADIGPTLGLSVPVAERRVRIALDWRERVAGRARPRSGPALSIGTDF